MNVQTYGISVSKTDISLVLSKELNRQITISCIEIDTQYSFWDGGDAFIITVFEYDGIGYIMSTGTRGGTIVNNIKKQESNSEK